MVSVVVFEFSGMRCQPLRRALALFLNLVRLRNDKRDNKLH
ncbi:acetyltransferase [Vibrio cholerae]|nr:acetyltransferase [Vibrio cholerae]